MSIKYLGENFDIHGGGRDLIFPHHENEIAQSESCTGNQFAKIWMHVGMVTIEGEKMSKSIGNVKSIKHVLENWGPNIIRLFCLSGHYSKPLDYSEELLKENLTKWRQAETCHYELIHASNENGENVDELIKKTSADFDKALENDLNTHLALSAVFQLIKESNRLAAEEKLGKDNSQMIGAELKRMLQILGLFIPEITENEKDRMLKYLHIAYEVKSYLVEIMCFDNKCETLIINSKSIIWEKTILSKSIHLTNIRYPYVVDP